MPDPLLTREVHQTLLAAWRSGAAEVECSLDLGRSTTTVAPGGDGFTWLGERFSLPGTCRERTVYYWTGGAFEPVARYSHALFKLVPTEWGPPTFEIDGIKMLPTARVSPLEDARRKVGLVRPRGRRVLDTCGGLGYFAACCLAAQAAAVLSFEKHAEVLWLRTLNPWSPSPGGALKLIEGDVGEHITALPPASVDCILHDPPRFGIAGELYSAGFYAELARVLRKGGRLFHYTGQPNALTSGRDVPREVARRLVAAGFATERVGDGVLATRQ